MTRTLSILIIDNNRYFTQGLLLGLEAYFYARSQPIRLFVEDTALASHADILFLGSSATCPPWLYRLYQRGYTPQVFFIRERERTLSASRPPSGGTQCGEGTLYRHRPLNQLDVLFDNLLSTAEGEKGALACRCSCSSLLTLRETEVLHCLANGMNGRDTARHLAISDKTANTHKASAMRKLNFRRNQELYLWLLQGSTWKTENILR